MLLCSVQLSIFIRHVGNRLPLATLFLVKFVYNYRNGSRLLAEGREKWMGDVWQTEQIMHMPQGNEAIKPILMLKHRVLSKEMHTSQRKNTLR